MPAFWPDTPLGQTLGAVWFRRQIIVPDAAAGKAATLRLGNVIECDVAYINGSRVGATTNQRNQVREYTVPPGVLLPGRNVDGPARQQQPRPRRHRAGRAAAGANHTPRRLAKPA